MDLKPCTQTQCAYLTAMPDKCPVCVECGAKAHVINEDCVNCWNCLKDEGYIRKGGNAITQEELVAVSIKGGR